MIRQMREKCEVHLRELKCLNGNKWLKGLNFYQQVLQQIVIYLPVCMTNTKRLLLSQTVVWKRLSLSARFVPSGLNPTGKPSIPIWVSQYTSSSWLLIIFFLSILWWWFGNNSSINGMVMLKPEALHSAVVVLLHHQLQTGRCQNVSD